MGHHDTPRRDAIVNPATGLAHRLDHKVKGKEARDAQRAQRRSQTTRPRTRRHGRATK